jgi:hypothetical protein
MLSGAGVKNLITDVGAPSAFAVREALHQVLESQPFRTSKQCQDLLRYIVDRSLSGDDASLRERVIGTEVFGRKATYDTGEDPVVRVRAADVRKRLAQYYQSNVSHEQTVRIELQPGSYLAHFRLDLPPRKEPIPLTVIPIERETPPEILTTAADASAKTRRFSPTSLRVLAVALAVVAIAGASIWLAELWKTPQERFWAPFINAKQPLLMYLGSNAAYGFTPDFLSKYSVQHGLSTNGPEFFPDLPPNGSVQVGDLVPVRDTYVTVGDLSASVQLATLVTNWKRAFVLRSARDLSFGDLRNRPSVLIGGFNNPWTLELTKGLPYCFKQGSRIQSRDHPERTWASTPINPKGDADDYALITRMPASETGGPLMTTAGIGQFGTQAAAEFVSNPDRMRDLLKSAPAGWQTRNMQVVLHIIVVGYTPVQVDVVATTYW